VGRDPLGWNPGVCALYDSGFEGGHRLLGLVDVELYRVAVPAQAVDYVIARSPGRCQCQACQDTEAMLHKAPLQVAEAVVWVGIRHNERLFEEPFDCNVPVSGMQKTATGDQYGMRRVSYHRRIRLALATGHRGSFDSALKVPNCPCRWLFCQRKRISTISLFG
jgi:hypothetical protein